MSDVTIIYTTMPDMEEASKIAEDLVERRMAACVNLLPGMVSIYEWNNEFSRTTEVVLFIKTRKKLADKVVQEVQRLHPYETPAILSLPVEFGSVNYLDWIKKQTA